MSDQDFLNLFKNVYLISISNKEIIINEGEIGNLFYVIYLGKVKVFVTDINNNEKILAFLSEGDYFGEQAYLKNQPVCRNASVAAATDVTLIAIPCVYFLKSIQDNLSLSGDLLRADKKKLLDHIQYIPPFDNPILYSAILETNCKIITAPADEILFSKGDPSANVYVIIHGIVSIQLDLGHTVRLSQGQIFGELGVLRQAPRAGAAICETAVTLLEIPGPIFHNFYDSILPFRTFVLAVQRFYSVKEHGFVTVEQDTFLDLPAIKTEFEFNGYKIISLNVISEPIFSMRRFPELSDTTISYQKITLTFYQKKITSIEAMQAWQSLTIACHLMLNQHALSEQDIQNFKQNGVLPEQQLAEDKIICACMQVPLLKLLSLINRGVKDIDTLRQITGAGSVCGACLPKVNTLLGRDDWSVAIMQKNRELNSQAAVFRVTLQDGKFIVPSAGQFIDMRIMVEKNLVERSYTIIAYNAFEKYYDIVIKKDENGYFTPWLFHQMVPVTARVSKPLGFFRLTTATRPLVFFAGGIGIAPAMAFINTWNQTQWNRLFYLDYSVRSLSEGYFVSDLEVMRTENKLFILNIRVTSTAKRLAPEDVTLIANQYLEADFYICGSHSYNTMIVQSLLKAGIKEQRIKTEYFTIEEL